MDKWKITHTGEIIHWVNGHDKDGAKNTFLPPQDCGKANAEPENYRLIDGKCVYTPVVISKEAAKSNKIKAYRLVIDINTTKVIEDFTYNSKSYKLTADVITQLAEWKSIVDLSDDPASEFPIDIVLGLADDNLEEVVTISTLSTFRKVVKAIYEHIKTVRKAAIEEKKILTNLTDQQLEAWVDKRIS